MGIRSTSRRDMDVNVNMDNPVIGIRSFGENASRSRWKGIAYAEGIESRTGHFRSQTFPRSWRYVRRFSSYAALSDKARDRLEKVELVPSSVMWMKDSRASRQLHLYVPALDDTKTHVLLLFSRHRDRSTAETDGFWKVLCFTDALMRGATTGKSDDPASWLCFAGNDILPTPNRLPKKNLQTIKEALDSGILYHAVHWSALSEDSAL